MRKVLALALGLVLIAGVVFAETGGESQTVYSVSIENPNPEHKDVLIPVTTIRPETDKLWGYDCYTTVGTDITSTTDTSTETWISIFDSTDSLMTGECFGEQESNAFEGIHDRWVNGKKITTGVSLRIGAYTAGQILFIRK